ncbi:hypothetical protein JCM10207_003409 [Rhodosporidiobolus poonsookiae]
MSTLPTGGLPRGALPAYLVSNTPPTPSRSPSNASEAGEEVPGEAEDESADESDFPEGDDADPDASTLSLARIAPALATPKPTAASPWPFNEPSEADNGGDRDLDYIPASSLPHEILLHILRLLPSSSLAPALRVCKAWCQCGVELLWHKPMFRSLPSFYRMLQVLSLPDPTFPYHDFVRRLNFNNLHSEMSDKMLAKLLPCTKIERLTLTGCKGLSSAAMVSLLAQSRRLIALDLSDVENVDDAVLEAMARNCPKLQGLNMSGCGRITDRGLEQLALGCPSLRRIKLRKCDAITDLPIVLLSLHCPLLLEVDLASCSSITSLAVMQLFRTSHVLRELSLPGCTALTDDGFPDADNFVLSSSASADPIYAGPAPSGSASGPVMTLTTGETIPLPTPLRSPPAFKPFDHLRYLDLTACQLVTDASVAGIVKYCPKLRNLILAKCTRLTDDALLEICKIGRNLHYLHLGHVGSITDRAVTALARACTRLRYIDVANCNNLTDLSVFELAANLPRLKRIGLVRVASITDEALYALHARPSLERIHLSYCDNLTVAGVNDMLQQLPRVTHLSLTGVSNFRRRALQQFCRAPPKDFNEHQRRTFCVFSGRGVQDLRKFLRSLTPTELAAIAFPEPLDEAVAGALGALPAAQQGAVPLPAPGPAAAPLTQNQQRLQQLQAARAAVAQASARMLAHQQAHAAQQLAQGQGQGQGASAGLPQLPGQLQPGQQPQIIFHRHIGAAAPAPGAAPGPGRAPALAPAPTFASAVNAAQGPPPAPGGLGGATLPFAPVGAFATRRPGARSIGADAAGGGEGGGGLTNGNMLGLQQVGGSPSASTSAHSQSQSPVPVPVRFVASGSGSRSSAPPTLGEPSTPRNAAMEIDGLGLDGAAGAAGGGAGRRARGATVTRSNYRRGGAAAADADEEDGEGDGEGEGGSGSESGGEEEDISMGEA